ncbi:hypothetical protein B7494_g1062 [Chlorociboria aeruginascens]|nr:hypothetical protein B7494_g1062 [Chlorociboria aeruginascens]
MTDFADSPHVAPASANYPLPRHLRPFPDLYPDVRSPHSNPGSPYSGLQTTPSDLPEVNWGHSKPAASEVREVYDGYPPYTPRSGDQTFLQKQDSQDDPSVVKLGRKTFWTLIVAIVVLFIAAIGGSVGAGLSAKRTATCPSTSTSSPLPLSSPSPPSSSSSSSSSSPSSTQSSATTSASSAGFTIASAATLNKPTTSCPQSNGTLFETPYTGGTFSIQCDISYSNSANIAQAMVFTLEDCINMCGAYNYWNSDTTCTHATYLPAGMDPYGNCWIQSGDRGTVVEVAGGTNTTYAFLQ